MKLNDKEMTHLINALNAYSWQAYGAERDLFTEELLAKLKEAN